MAARRQPPRGYQESPKGVGMKKKVESKKDVSVHRRRLTVVSANNLIEGLGDLNAEEEGVKGGDYGHVVTNYAGVSKKGYAPYNPRKKNQDSLIMAEDSATESIMFGVYDGHGEAGDLVSQYFQKRFPKVISFQLLTELTSRRWSLSTLIFLKVLN
jgi:hypothetical protein